MRHRVEWTVFWVDRLAQTLDLTPRLAFERSCSRGLSTVQKGITCQEKISATIFKWCVTKGLNTALKII